MKIAISSFGKNLESDVDVRFGRCAFFLIVDVENKKIGKVKVIENLARTQMGGAGITAAETVANEKPDAIISSNFGPRAFSVFEQLRIKTYVGKGKIRDVIQEFIDGKLEEVTSATGPQFMGV